MDIECTDCGQPIEVSLLCGECSVKSDRLLSSVIMERDAFKRIAEKDIVRIGDLKREVEYLREQCNAEFQVQGEGKE